MNIGEAALIAASGLWLALPALLPNSAAVLFGGGTPIDMGRSWRGRRILGDGKTWTGFIGGAAAGIALGLILIGVAVLAGWEDNGGFGPIDQALGVITALSIGSLLGDMLGSFIKRRLGIPRGAKFPILDQYDFLIGAFIIVGICYPQWLYNSYLDGWRLLALLTLLVATPLLHRLMNILGYRMGKKEVPW
ncbi:MAG: CDP-2,3-bis-(O-geranylgeranyl)-sn-glycerol synthase [Candidatus Methanomethylophilaceae archaeon]|nr:CDP-2,3-bis-(O-geranylgeranyl)-sn-glycerol synthase [Candidatus Methanomethylophilaceae archaeon]MDI3541452.1 CDP-2,3-bis-(O-geranylgeranyl)-sn-glycerol synthase [Candidatus Methanomethylophilaceae archaeon]